MPKANPLLQIKIGCSEEKLDLERFKKTRLKTVSVTNGKRKRKEYQEKTPSFFLKENKDKK